MELKLNKSQNWAIAYINRDFLYCVEADLKKYPEYHDVTAYIPTVRILRKQFKGRDIFEEVPLLFNYGFFNIPGDKLQVEFIQKMKERVLGIHAWVKDTKTIITTRPSLIVGNEPLVREDIIPVALATSGEIAQLINMHKQLSIYDKYDVDKLKPGMLITLKGYPFEGMDAIVKNVDKKKETVEVELQLESIMKHASVSFDNIFYTVYHSVKDESMKEKYIEDLKVKKRKHD